MAATHSMRAFVAATLVLAMLIPANAAAQPRAANPAEPSVRAAAMPTTTALTVTPTSGDSATVFNVRANVAPIPGGSEVRFTLWTAASGGELLWDHSFAVDSVGVARVPGGINLDPGTQWWQAEFLGNEAFGPSTSARKSVSVSGLESTLSGVSVTWREGWGETINYRGTGGPIDTSGGAIELVVDGEVYASCRQSSSTGPQCTAINLLDPGLHIVYVRYVPNNVRYGSASSAPMYYPTGPARPPASGIAIEGGRFSTRTVLVGIDVAAQEAGNAVDLVRLSNSAEVGSDGLLVGGTTVDYQAAVPWQLASGADGWRTVWAQLGDTSGNWSAPYLDQILLDTTAPGGSFVINGDDETIGDPWTNSYSTQSITGVVTDGSTVHGGVITHVALSNDGKRFQLIPYDWASGQFETPWEFSNGWGAPAHTDPGVKTVYAKWRDQAGNWSTVVTDTIRYVNTDDVGYVLVDGERYVVGDPLYRSSPEVTVKIVVEAPPPEGVDGVWVGDEVEDGTGAKWIDWPGAATEMTFQLSTIDPAYGYSRADGIKNVGVYVVSNSGRRKPAGGMLVILDRVVPVADGPIPAFALGTQVAENDLSAVSRGVTPTSAMSVLTEIAWRHADRVSQYQLERLNGGAWAGVQLVAPKTNSTRTEMSPGVTRQYRVKTRLTSGATSTWKKGPAFSVLTRQETDTAITYSGPWLSESRGDAFGDSLRYTTKKGAFARMTFTGRGIAWVAPKFANGDSVAVYVDGNFIKLVHLTSPYYQASRVVFSMAWKNRGTHTIKIVKRYANGRRAPVDALLVLN